MRSQCPSFLVSAHQPSILPQDAIPDPWNITGLCISLNKPSVRPTVPGPGPVLGPGPGPSGPGRRHGRGPDHGPGRGLGPGLGPGPRAIVEKSENFKISKVLRMDLPIVENLSGLSGHIFSLSRIPQLHFNKKFKNWSNYINIPRFP